MEQYFEHYASLEQQRWMVADEVRTTAFAKAIAEVVKPGDVVVDVGAGTGILSMFAARAGARRVIGVERSGMAELARQIIQHNGLDDRVEIFQGNADHLELDEPADVIVSEWLGHMAYVEDMLRSVLKVRRAWLKPGGTMLPASVELLLAPADSTYLYRDHGPGFWQKAKVHGLDFSPFTDLELQNGHTMKLQVKPEVLMAPGAVIHQLDIHGARVGDEWAKGTAAFEMQRSGVVNGFVGWFRTQLSPSVLLDTSPELPWTHWEQTWFPFHPMPVEQGQTLRVRYRTEDPFDGSRVMLVTLGAGGHEIRYIVE